MHVRLCVAFCAAAVAASAASAAPPAAPRYKAVEYPRLRNIPGLSDALLAMHLTLYQGYVKNANLLAEKLSALLASGGERGPEYAELKRRFGWEYDGMRLHELYFENLGGGGRLDPAGALASRLAADFGSVEAWKRDFTATGLMRGIGWAALVDDPRSGRLVNVWINEHDTGHLAGARVVLIMDVFEHAYLTEFRLDRAKYIDAFLGAADWKAAENRLGAR